MKAGSWGVRGNWRRWLGVGQVASPEVSGEEPANPRAGRPAQSQPPAEVRDSEPRPLETSAQDLAPPNATVALVYCSRAQPTDNPFALLRSLRTESLVRNVPNGVASVLMYQDGWFCQWLQAADEAALEATFLRVRTDPRHDAVSVLYRGPASPLSSVWSMMLRTRKEPSSRIAQRMRRLVAQAAQAPMPNAPTAVLAFCDDRLPPPLGPHRVQTVRVMSKPLSLCVSAVEYLGRNHPDARTTVARWGRDNDSDPDLQGLHVDATVEGVASRVIAIPRRVMAVGWVRTLVAPDDAWVVLMQTLDLAGLERKLLAIRSALRVAAGLNPVTGRHPDDYRDAADEGMAEATADATVDAQRLADAATQPMMLEHEPRGLALVHVLLQHAPSSAEVVQLDVLAERYDCRIRWDTVPRDDPAVWCEAVMRAVWPSQPRSTL